MQDTPEPLDMMIGDKHLCFYYQHCKATFEFVNWMPGLTVTIGRLPDGFDFDVETMAGHVLTMLDQSEIDPAAVQEAAVA